MPPKTFEASPQGSIEFSAGGASYRIPSLALVFLAALAIRWSYSLAIYFYMGDIGLKGMDSYGFVEHAAKFAEAVRSGNFTFTDFLGVNPYTMPLFHWLAGISFFLFWQQSGTLAYVLMQGIFDAGTCVIVFLIAERMSTRIALAASVFAIFNPTMIVMSGLFYADTPFTFFVALSFLLTLRWLDRPSTASSAMLGASLAFAALVRVVITPWAFAAIALLAILGLFRRYALKQIATLFLTLMLLCVAVGIVLIKNKRLYDTIGISPQGGIHLALWIVPLAKEMHDRTPYAATFEAMERKTLERFGPHPSNFYEQSRQYSEIAKEALKDIPFSALVKSWASGMAINLVSPAVVLAPPVSQIPRVGFVDTPGGSFGEKIYNYAFRSKSALYSWLLIVGAIGLTIARALQLVGIASLARRTAFWPALLVMLSWCGYILLVNGPIASPKYRLPLEPLFSVMAGAGLIAASDWRNKRNKSV